ncbi:MAG: hypothetical protein U0V74_05165 [Chitinophagales bacterium]
MKENHIIVNKTARFYTLGNISDKTRYIWLVVHGFGQSAESFLKNFESLANEQHFFIAPEALNRFYLKGAGGDVGATWMTKADRLNEIKDYINYLDDVYDLFEFEKHADAKVIALGFSQGASTITRWMNATQKHVDHLVVYAGEVGPELIPLAANSGLKHSKNHLIYGNKDEYFPVEMMHKAIEHWKELNLNVVEFEGGHVIKPELLQKLLSSF